MGSTVENLQNVLEIANKEKSMLDQFSNFEVTINNLKKIIEIEGPKYNLPQVDTIGLKTYSILNKK